MNGKEFYQFVVVVLTSNSASIDALNISQSWYGFKSSNDWYQCIALPVMCITVDCTLYPVGIWYTLKNAWHISTQIITSVLSNLGKSNLGIQCLQELPSFWSESSDPTLVCDGEAGTEVTWGGSRKSDERIRCWGWCWQWAYRPRTHQSCSILMWKLS